MKPDIFNIIPKQKKIIPKWVNFTIIGSFVVALLVIGLFVFYYYQALLWKNKLEAKESEFLALNSKENHEIELQVSEIAKKLERFSKAFASRNVEYDFFDFVRSFCHTRVSFSSLSFDNKTGSTALSGETDSYKSLSEQILILKDLKNISNLLISDVSLGKEGNVSFKISFIYKK